MSRISIENEGGIHFVFGRHSEYIGRLEFCHTGQWKYIPRVLYKLNPDDLRELLEYIEAI